MLKITLKSNLTKVIWSQINTDNDNRNSHIKYFYPPPSCAWFFKKKIEPPSLDFFDHHSTLPFGSTPLQCTKFVKHVKSTEHQRISPKPVGQKIKNLSIIESNTPLHCKKFEKHELWANLSEIGFSILISFPTEYFGEGSDLIMHTTCFLCSKESWHARDVSIYVWRGEPHSSQSFTDKFVSRRSLQ